MSNWCGIIKPSSTRSLPNDWRDGRRPVRGFGNSDDAATVPEPYVHEHPRERKKATGAPIIRPGKFNGE
jgi:hypothetical protein